MPSCRVLPPRPLTPASRVFPVRRINSLFGQEKFPVRLQQGFGVQRLGTIMEFATQNRQNGRKLVEFPVIFPVLSFSPGVARPAVDQTLLAWSCGVGTEVDHSLVRLSPFLSWTRGSQSTPDCRHGPSSVPEHA